MNWRDVGSRIRQQREYMGYTREQLAELLDVTPKFCSDIELGVKGMSVPTLCKLSEALRLSTDYILFGHQHGKRTDHADARNLLPNRTRLCRAALENLYGGHECKNRFTLIGESACFSVKCGFAHAERLHRLRCCDLPLMPLFDNPLKARILYLFSAFILALLLCYGDPLPLTL